jgi:cytochrome c oxidase subunit I+III
MAIVATGLLSFGLWVHHMFTVGLPLLALALFGAASMTIAIPSGVQVFAWLATMLNAKRLVLNAPMLFSIGFIVTFVVGGLTGVMTAVVPFDWQVHDTYFVVAHFHYVLVGGVVFPIFAAFYYWLPKVQGRLYDERLGKLTFWLWFIGFNLCFLPQHNAGLLGMPRRVFTYPAELGLGPYNLVSTIGAYLMALGTLTFLWTMYQALRSGQPAAANPWNAGTLDWSVESPTPPYIFRTLPAVRSRYPLWDDGWAPWVPERTAPAPAEPPRVWAETLGTTALDARPESIVRLGGPSIWPFATGVAVTVVSVALLFDLHLLTLVSLLASLALAARWMWPSREERELPGVGATLGNPALPVHTTGPAATGWWAMALTILGLAITLAYLLFSYFYLLFGHAEWPLDGIAPPGLVVPAISTLLLLASAVPIRLAEAGIQAGSARRLQLGLTLTSALGLAFLALQMFDYLNAGFAPQTNAYAAIFYVLAGNHVVLALAGIGINAFVQARAWRGHFDGQRFLAVQNAALYWYFVIGAWIATAGTLYLAPYLT